MPVPISKTVVTVGDGKYRVVHRNDPNTGTVTFDAFRNGEHFRDLTGDGLMLAMLHEVDSFKPRSIPADFRIVGTNHRPEFPKVVERGLLVPNAKLELVADPDNAYDKNAVKVMLGEDWIGFVERDAAPRILMMLRFGMAQEAKLTQYDPDLSAYEQLRAEVAFKFYVKSA
jgi:hypothetical protein